MYKLFNQKGFSHHLIMPVVAVLIVASIGTYLVTKSSAYSYMSGVTPYACKQDPTPTLKPNNSKNNKNCVRAMQYRLNQWIKGRKISTPKLKVDGVYGKGTLVAVKKFQKNTGLNANGVVNKATWSKLSSYCVTQPKVTSGPCKGY